MQWRATVKGEKMPLFAPGHPVNPVCVICGAAYFDRPVVVEGRDYLRTDIGHDWPLHKNHPGISDDVTPAQMLPPRRAFGYDDD